MQWKAQTHYSTGMFREHTLLAVPYTTISINWAQLHPQQFVCPFLPSSVIQHILSLSYELSTEILSVPLHFYEAPRICLFATGSVLQSGRPPTDRVVLPCNCNEELYLVIFLCPNQTWLPKKYSLTQLWVPLCGHYAVMNQCLAQKQ